MSQLTDILAAGTPDIGNVIWLVIIIVFSLIGKIIESLAKKKQQRDAERRAEQQGSQDRELMERIRRQQHGQATTMEAPPTVPQQSDAWQRKQQAAQQRAMQRQRAREQALELDRQRRLAMERARQHMQTRPAEDQAAQQAAERARQLAQQQAQRARLAAQQAAQRQRHAPPPPPAPAQQQQPTSRQHIERIDEQMAQLQTRMEQLAASRERHLAAMRGEEPGQQPQATHVLRPNIRPLQDVSGGQLREIVAGLEDPAVARQAIIFMEILSPAKALRQSPEMWDAI